MITKETASLNLNNGPPAYILNSIPAISITAVSMPATFTLSSLSNFRKSFSFGILLHPQIEFNFLGDVEMGLNLNEFAMNRNSVFLVTGSEDGYRY